MTQQLSQQTLYIDGMSCSACEMRIERKLKAMEGVVKAKASYNSSEVQVSYDPNVLELDDIIEALATLDYLVIDTGQHPAVGKPSKVVAESKGERLPINLILGTGMILFALYLIIQNTVGFNFIPTVTQNMGYGLLFVVGLITSVHCIAMCGGINLSQCVSYQCQEGEGKLAKLKPSLLYNLGRVLAYTLIGAIIGALGSVVSFSGTAKGAVAILSGLFMVIMGLNMLNIFPWLRRFNPRMPKLFGNKMDRKHGPFYVGLLNGLMPCGPLQAMQIYALGSGSALAGAMSMFMFSLGTVPLMFGFGAISSFLSGKFTHKMMKVSAVLVMVLGIVMVNRGLSLSGVNIAYAFSAPQGNVAVVKGDVQEVTTKLESGRYEPIVVQAGIPVRWNIQAEADAINGCNNEIIIPKYNLTKKLVTGDNIIEFTPDTAGNIAFSCWMGMIRSNIKVVADAKNVSAGDVKAVQDSVATSSGGCGSSGCGGSGG